MARTKTPITPVSRAAGQDLAARTRGAKTRSSGLLARTVSFDEENRRIVFELRSGFMFGVPVHRLTELRRASDVDIAAVELLGAGGIVHWEALDVDYSVPALILDSIGRAAAQTELARTAGRATSRLKAAAARRNGNKGGRPKKTAR